MIIEENPNWFAGRSLAIDPINSNTVYGGGEYYSSPSSLTMAVVKTTDGWFENWSITSLISHRGYVHALAIDPSNPDIIYAGGNYCDENEITYAGLFKSTDSGTRWVDISLGIDDKDSPIYTLAIDPGSSTTIYAGTSGGIYKSTDGGESWNNTICGFDSVYVLSIDPSSTDIIYAGTKNGVYSSTDGGSTWSGMNQGLSFLDVRSFEIDPIQTDRIYAGTHDGGVFGQNVVGIEETESPIPASDHPILYQNYPNPFSSFCTIEYYLSTPSEVSLRIYDSTGRLVRELMDQSRQVGLHIIKWDGRDARGRLAPSNVYFCHLRGEEFSATRKILFIK